MVDYVGIEPTRGGSKIAPAIPMDSPTWVYDQIRTGNLRVLKARCFAVLNYVHHYSELNFKKASLFSDFRGLFYFISLYIAPPSSFVIFWYSLSPALNEGATPLYISVHFPDPLAAPS